MFSVCLFTLTTLYLHLKFSIVLTLFMSLILTYLHRVDDEILIKPTLCSVLLQGLKHHVLAGREGRKDVERNIP